MKKQRKHYKPEEAVARHYSQQVLRLARAVRQGE